MEKSKQSEARATKRAMSHDGAVVCEDTSLYHPDRFWAYVPIVCDGEDKLIELALLHIGPGLCNLVPPQDVLVCHPPGRELLAASLS